jgi:hypothetical protein
MLVIYILDYIHQKCFHFRDRHRHTPWIDIPYVCFDSNYVSQVGSAGPGLKKRSFLGG